MDLPEAIAADDACYLKHSLPDLHSPSMAFIPSIQHAMPAAGGSRHRTHRHPRRRRRSLI
jgi:hypothetical protein